jgi:transposase
MIHVGADLHQRFCYMTALDASGRKLNAGAVPNQAEALRNYFGQFRGPVQVAVEACSFWPAFREAVGERAEVRLVHPQRVKAIAAAKLKNDRIDSGILAHLLRCDLLPGAWMADAETQALRQQVRLRASLVRQRTRSKNQVHALLHQQGLRFEGTDLFGCKGRVWLAKVEMPAGTRSAVKVHLKLIDEYTRQIAGQDRRLERLRKQDVRAQWLETIPGIGKYSSLLLLAEIGDIRRFANKRALSHYSGLIPWMRESADRHRSGGITKVGSPWLRWILVEAAQTAIRSAPEVHAWFARLAQRKHKHTAVVAVARKLLVAVWSMLHDGVVYDESHFALK